MTEYIVPVCSCNHPIDCHDPNTGKCIGVNVSGCQCGRFTDSGRTQKVHAT